MPSEYAYGEPLDRESPVISKEAMFVLIGALSVMLVNFVVCIKTKLITGAGRVIESFLRTRCYPIWKLIERGLAVFGISTQDQDANNNIQRHDAEHCPLCLAGFTHPVVATCGHSFCGKCMLDYWETKQRRQLDCPLCRRPISMLIKDFHSPPILNETHAPMRHIMDGIRHYNLLFSKKPRTIKQIILDAPFLLSRFCDFVRSREGVLFFIRKIIGSAYILMFVLYILSPLDLIPDVIPFIGYLDDMIVASFILLQVTMIYFNYLRHHPSQN